MTTLNQSDPTPEAVKKMVPPPQPGISYVMRRCIVAELAGANAGERAFAVRNPELVDCIITNVTLDITTAAESAKAVLDVDVVSDADSKGHGIIDGLPLAATGTFDRHTGPSGNSREKLRGQSREMGPARWRKTISSPARSRRPTRPT